MSTSTQSNTQLEKARASESGAGFTLKIVTPERLVKEFSVTQVTLPTVMGEITVLPHHIPLVAKVSPGEIVVKDAQGAEHSFAVSGGFVQVYPGKLVILADTADMAHEISEEQALVAHKRAQELLAAKTGLRDREYAALQVLMDKEFARLKVARKYKQRGIRAGDIK